MKRVSKLFRFVEVFESRENLLLQLKLEKFEQELQHKKEEPLFVILDFFENNKDIKLTPQYYHLLLNSFFKEGKHKQALEYFENNNIPIDLETIKFFTKHYFPQKRYKEVFEAFEKIKDEKVHLLAIQYILEQMIVYEFEPYIVKNIYEQVLSTSDKTPKELKEKFIMFSVKRGLIDPKAKIFNNKTDHLIQLRHHYQQKNMTEFNLLFQQYFEMFEPKVQVELFSYLISHSLEINNIPTAIDHYLKLQDYDLYPNYQILYDLLSSKIIYQRHQTIYQKIIQDVKSHPEKKSPSFLNLLVLIASKEDSLFVFKNYEKLFKRYKKKPNHTTYKFMISALCRDSHIKEALFAMNQMLKSSIVNENVFYDILRYFLSNHRDKTEFIVAILELFKKSNGKFITKKEKLLELMNNMDIPNLKDLLD